MNTYIIVLVYTPSQEYGDGVYTIVGRVFAESPHNARMIVEQNLGTAYDIACADNVSRTGYHYVTECAYYDAICVEELDDISKKG